MVWAILLIGLAFGQDLKQNLDKLKEKEKEYLKNFKITLPTERKEYQEYKETIRPQVEELKKSVEEYRQRMTVEDGKVVVKQKKERVSLAKDERLYVLMSSSVPMVVWRNYAKAIESYNLSDSAFLVLRGCIGGCKYFRPTLEFIKKVIAPTEKEQLSVEVQIDPLIFRRFNVQKVPCFVYVKGDELFNPELSAGMSENLKKKGTYATSCGDWAFEYHLKELCKKTNSPTLCKVSEM